MVPTGESLRLKTIAGATSYTFLLEDATGFPCSFLPALKIGLKSTLPIGFLGADSASRKIPLGRRALTGLQPTSKSDHLGHFESALERDLFIQLEFDPVVQSWHPQPVRIEVPSEKGRTTHYHPDVAVEYLESESVERSRPVWMLYEVKYASELKTNWKELRPRYKAALKYAKSRDWGFRILTERDIRSDYLFNAKFLLPYLRHAEVDGWTLLLGTIRRLGRTTPNKLLGQISSDRWRQAELLTNLWTLIARRDVQCNLMERISMTMDIWVNA